MRDTVGIDLVVRVRKAGTKIMAYLPLIKVNRPTFLNMCSYN